MTSKSNKGQISNKGSQGKALIPTDVTKADTAYDYNCKLIIPELWRLILLFLFSDRPSHFRTFLFSICCTSKVFSLKHTAYFNQGKTNKQIFDSAILHKLYYNFLTSRISRTFKPPMPLVVNIANCFSCYGITYSRSLLDTAKSPLLIIRESLARTVVSNNLVNMESLLALYNSSCFNYNMQDIIEPLLNKEEKENYDWLMNLNEMRVHYGRMDIIIGSFFLGRIKMLEMISNWLESFKNDISSGKTHCVWIMHVPYGEEARKMVSVIEEIIKHNDAPQLTKFCVKFKNITEALSKMYCDFYKLPLLEKV